MAEFGECVWYLKSDSAGKDKYVNRWCEGVWLGINDETGECIVGIEGGKGVQGKPIVKGRWDIGKFVKTRVDPWKTSVHAEGDELRIKINMPSDDGPLSEHVRTRVAEVPDVRR